MADQSFKAHMVGNRLRFLKLALQFLGKIGSELLIEAMPHKLILRSINSTRSAYAAVTFQAHFFNGYDTFGSQVVQAGIVLKQALALFRAQRISKTTLELIGAENRLAITILSDNGLQKQYRIPCMDCEVLQATIDEEAFPISVVAAAKELSRLLSSFQTSLDEITLIALPQQQAPAAKAVQIHSYVDPAKGLVERSLRTQIEVDAQKLFLEYRHAGSEPSDVTFNLKDFRAMLALCEGLNANMSVSFEAPGSPVVVKPHVARQQETDFTAVLVLATLRNSQLEAVEAARNSARSHQAGRTPNIPGDTPWTRAAPNGQGPTSARGTGMRSHAAPRPSRFAADADGGPPARPEFDAAVTPVRLPPFPGPVNPQSASVQPRPDPHADAEQNDEEEPGPATRPSGRVFDSETEFAQQNGSGEHWQGDDLDGLGNGDDPPGSRAEQEQGPLWHDIEQPQDLPGSMGRLGMQDGDEEAPPGQPSLPPLRSRYRAVIDDEMASQDSDAFPSTPPD